MRRERTGFSMIELLLVIVVMGIIAGIGLPKFGAMRDRANVSSARLSVAGALATARAAAIRRGATATFYANANEIWVTIDSSGTELDLIRKTSLNTENGVGISFVGSTSKIAYNGRGMATGSGGKIYVTLGARSDSVCVTVLGAVLRQGCL